MEKIESLFGGHHKEGEEGAHHGARSHSDTDGQGQQVRPHHEKEGKKGHFGFGGHKGEEKHEEEKQNEYKEGWPREEDMASIFAHKKNDKTDKKDNDLSSSSESETEDGRERQKKRKEKKKSGHSEK